MKTLFGIFFLSFGILSVCHAQNKKKNTMKFQNCQEIIHNFYPQLKNIKAIKKSDKIVSISCFKEHTLSDQSDIDKYFHKITDKNNHFYTYNPKSKVLVLRQRKNITKRFKKSQKYFSSLNKRLYDALKPGSTVYAMKLKTNSGKTFRDYFITNASNRFTYENTFAGLLFMKFKEVSVSGNHKTIKITKPSGAVKVMHKKVNNQEVIKVDTVYESHCH